MRPFSLLFACVSNGVQKILSNPKKKKRVEVLECSLWPRPGTSIGKVFWLQGILMLPQTVTWRLENSANLPFS